MAGGEGRGVEFRLCGGGASARPGYRLVRAEADQRRIPVGAALAVTRTTDGGKTFSELRAGLPQQHCYDLVYRHGLALADDARTLLMGSTSGGLWLSEDGGDHWQTVSTTMPPIYAVCFAG